jgi:hypothetical protein
LEDDEVVLVVTAPNPFNPPPPVPPCFFFFLLAPALAIWSKVVVWNHSVDLFSLLVRDDDDVGTAAVRRTFGLGTKAAAECRRSIIHEIIPTLCRRIILYQIKNALGRLQLGNFKDDG